MVPMIKSATGFDPVPQKAVIRLLEEPVEDHTRVFSPEALILVAIPVLREPVACWKFPA